MTQYTPTWYNTWIARGPRAWLLLLLVGSFLVGLGAAPQAQHWVEWVPPHGPCPGWLRVRPSRLGHRLARASHIVVTSAGCLAGRTALLLGLLAASRVAQWGLETWPLAWLPALDWGLHLLGVLWPALATRPGYRAWAAAFHRLYQCSVLGLGLLTLSQVAQTGLGRLSLSLSPAGLALGSVVVCERDGSHVTLAAQPQADGPVNYHIVLEGRFVIDRSPRDRFEQRLLILLLRWLRTPGRETSPWGIVRQEDLATVFQVKQEDISGWQGYVDHGEWAHLFGLAPKSLLSDEVREQIIAVWAPNIWQGVETVQQRLAEQGVRVARRVVEEAGRQSGLMQIRAALQAQYVHGPAGVRPQEDYLIQQLFTLVDQLQAQVAAGQGAPQAVTVDVAALRQLASVPAPTPEKCLEKPWPWLFCVEHWLFGDWDLANDGTGPADAPVHCLYCGSEHVARKSRQPRDKTYVDDQGQRQTVAVYRYYCLNPDCHYGTFTNLPPGLVPYSPWRLDARLRAVALYTGLRTTYRGAAVTLGVAPSTLYHWLAQFGGGALPIAAWFGLVRSSGVVGIDEKYVKVPKNDKPASKQRKWMYVYVAVDVHTLDLLHLEIFPHLGQDSARTFLLGLRARGYSPRVIVTDLCADYPAALAAVFPQAVHHECVFHALQAWQRALKDGFGRDYAERRPELVELRQALKHLFKAKTRRTVQKRYDLFMAHRDAWVHAEPALQPIFDSLERHFPTLRNAYDCPLIPLTNNATERLIRCFDQHYQNFAGFDSLETARCYLHLFELTYRFTPFGPEVQPHLRGKCPLELAGYDLTRIPFARYLREHSLRPLIPNGPPPAEVVPK